MKISKSLIAVAVIATLPLAAFAGDKDKTVAPMGTATSAQFDTLDTNRDGRLSPAEATSDSKIVFSTADKNGDGYLDGSEYTIGPGDIVFIPRNQVHFVDPGTGKVGYFLVGMPSSQSGFPVPPPTPGRGRGAQ